MSDNRRIAKNTLFLYFRMFLIIGISLYTSRVIFAVLGVEDFGLYNVVGGIIAMFSVLNGIISSSTSRFLTYELGKNNIQRLTNVFSASFFSHVFISIVILVLAETVGLWFINTQLVIPEDRLNAANWVYQFSILAAMISFTQSPYSALIISHERMNIYAYMSIIEVVLKLLIVYVLVISSFDKLKLYSVLMFVVTTIIALIYRIYCIKHYKESRLRIVKNKALYKQLISYSGRNLIGAIVVLLQGQGINILLNVFFGPIINAARAISYQVQGAIIQFSNNFFTAVKPQIVKLYAQNNIEEMMKLMYQSSYFSFYLLFLIILPLILEMQYVLNLWLKNVPAYTVSFTILILLNQLIVCLKNPRMAIFEAMGKIKRANIFVGLTMITIFPISYLLLKLGFSPIWVFYVMIIVNFISEIVSSYVLRCYMPFNVWQYFYKVYGKCLIVALIASFPPCCVIYIMPSSFVRLCITVIISTISILITVFYLGINKEMKTKALIFLHNKILRVRT